MLLLFSTVLDLITQPDNAFMVKENVWLLDLPKSVESALAATLAATLNNIQLVKVHVLA